MYYTSYMTHFESETQRSQAIAIFVYMVGNGTHGQVLWGKRYSIIRSLAIDQI